MNRSLQFAWLTVCRNSKCFDLMTSMASKIKCRARALTDNGLLYGKQPLNEITAATLSLI